MRLPTFRSILGSLGLAVLIVYTMRLPDHAQAVASSPTVASATSVASLPVPPTPQPTLVVARPIERDFVMPVEPAPRVRVITGCFTADPVFATPVIWKESAVIAAAEKRDWETVRKLIDAGAPVESTNQTGITALMVAAKQGNLEVLRSLIDRQARIDFMDFEGRTAIDYALAAGERDAVEVLFSLLSKFDPSSAGAHRLLTAAISSGDLKIFQTVLQRFPPTLAWTTESRRALNTLVEAGLTDQVRLLLSKHPAPPTRDGGIVPLIAYAIASDDRSLFQALLLASADPNTVIPKDAEKEFTDLLKSKYLRLYIQADPGVNILMLAAGLGRADYVRALLDAGADRNRHTSREKMLPLYFAAWTENWQCVQMLLGGGPQPEQLRVEISLAKQHMAVIKDGATVFETKVSTGRNGFTTKSGYYVITDKDRDHRSTIYKCPMPYFMRLSCRDFGLHEGVVQPYPASHGCIRLPGDAAKKLFVDLPIGTVVSIN
jgi:ankyrin repeat protein